MEEKKDGKVSSDVKIRVLVSSFLLVILVGLVIGFTYAIFTYQGIGKEKNTVRTGELTFSYTELNDGISLTDALPVSDEVGKKMQGNDRQSKYFDFAVSCKMSGTQNIQYEIYSTEVDVDQKLDPSYVKVYLTDSSTDRAISGYEGQVPVYSNLKSSSIQQGAKRLYAGKFNSSGRQSFRLRLWLSDQYKLTSTAKKFKIKVNVSATN